MKQALQKHVRTRLENREYRALRRCVLRRDGWRCQFCGSMTNLEVHHQQFRSHSGDDKDNNLITLCSSCHRTMHVSGPQNKLETALTPLKCGSSELPQ
jgi:5-methylcytosine-specific restriction endonuclease McrA